MDLIAVIGIIASICTTGSMLPQLIKIIKEKKAENVSTWMIVVLLAGGALWVWYGVGKKDLIIIISNGIAFIINATLSIFTIKYKKTD